MTTAALVMACLRCIPVCPDDWTEFQDKCYYASENGNTWEESRYMCKRKGADLMVIDHAMEQAFLKSKMKDKGTIWIGLHYIQAENAWRWVDGKNLSYKNWQGGRPQKEHEGNDVECVAAGYEHKWTIHHCRSYILSICEKSRHVVCDLCSPFQPQLNFSASSSRISHNDCYWGTVRKHARQT
ncbi:collectin-12-like [Sceloporus undulatus]|uniref:collectin-12-like n=1 Tax=Sceloporus undulatus TaxID=8520 RepID=UPI001C4DCF8D|nr:collectin-12-like [Sceloporus undulatus]